MEGHAEMDMSVQRRGTVLQRLLLREGFDATAAYFVMDWAAVARDIFGGLLIAGAVAVWVPDSCLDGRELRRAGVGSATLYRNLANRRQLSDLRFSLDRNALARFRRRVCEAAPTGLPTRHTPLVHAPGGVGARRAGGRPPRHDGDHTLDAVGDVQVDRRGRRNCRSTSGHLERPSGPSDSGTVGVAEAQGSPHVL
jgi:hypothetical protein